MAPMVLRYHKQIYVPGELGNRGFISAGPGKRIAVQVIAEFPERMWDVPVQRVDPVINEQDDEGGNSEPVVRERSVIWNRPPPKVWCYTIVVRCCCCE